MRVEFYLDASGRIVGQLWTMVPRFGPFISVLPPALFDALTGVDNFMLEASTSDWGSQLRAAHNDH
jgi:hypothetical protein